MKSIIRELQDHGNNRLAAKVKRVLAAGPAYKGKFKELSDEEQNEIQLQFDAEFNEKFIPLIEKIAEETETRLGVIINKLEKRYPGISFYNDESIRDAVEEVFIMNVDIDFK